MRYDHITTDQHLRDFCEIIAAAPIVAFDTEFVSEDSFQPELCLIQLAAAGPAGDRRSAGSAGSVAAVGAADVAGPGDARACRPRRVSLFAASTPGGGRPAGSTFRSRPALIGLEYPASYGTLSAKLIGKTIAKDETRTDWRRRPLTQRQLEYALLDVADLEAIRNVLHARLSALGRLPWLADELADWQHDLVEFETRRALACGSSGLAGLAARSLAIVRELSNWRDSEAERRNQPARRIFRDDLLDRIGQAADRRSEADSRRPRHGARRPAAVSAQDRPMRREGAGPEG